MPDVYDQKVSAWNKRKKVLSGSWKYRPSGLMWPSQVLNLLFDAEEA